MEQDRPGELRTALTAIAAKQGCSDGEARKKTERTIRNLKRRVLDKHNEKVRWRRYGRWVDANTDQKVYAEANAEALMRLYLADGLASKSGASAEKLEALTQRNYEFSKVEERAKEFLTGDRKKPRKDWKEERAIDLEKKIHNAGWLPPRPNKRGRPKGWTKQQAKVVLREDGMAAADRILIAEADLAKAATALLNMKDIVAIAAECIKEHAGDMMGFTKPLRRSEKGQTDSAYLAWGAAVEMLRPEANAEVIVREMRTYRKAYLLSEPQDADIMFKFSDHRP
jgi:hypothetical protein